MMSNIRKGIVFGVALATFYSLFAGTIMLVGGPVAFERNGTTLLGALCAYYASGIVGGALVGALSPWTKHYAGTIVISIIAAIVVFFGIEVATAGSPQVWTSQNVKTPIGLGFLFGIILGNYIWKQRGRSSA